MNTTLGQEPQIGQPQTLAGMEILNQAGQNTQNGIPNMVVPNGGQQSQPHTMNQVLPQINNGQINPSQGQVGNASEINNFGAQQAMQTQQTNQAQQQFPTIPDNNPVAELPNNGNNGILENVAPNLSNTTNGMELPGAPMQQNPGMGMAQQNMGMPNMMNQNPGMGMAQQNMGIPQQNMGMPNMNQNPGIGMAQQNMGMPNMMNQNPGMNNNQQQMNYQNPGMGMPQQNMGMPNMMNQNPGMGMAQQNMGMPNMNQQNMGMPQQPGSTAPGFNNGSYLQNNGGMFGPTPTGHPEKQKFQMQFTLVYAKARPTSKGSLITTGLIANPNDRNAPAINFVCFSGSATKQIQILEDVSRPNYTTIEKAGGQPIFVEASWQWNDKNKNQPAAWQLMCDNFVFVNDQNLRVVAENWTPPVPPSPMDMLSGGNMQMQNMMGQNPGMGMAQQNMGMNQNPNMNNQQQMGYQNPGMGMNQNPNMNHQINYQYPGMGMPGQQ